MSSTFVLVPGAGGALYWHLVVPLLADAGLAAVAVELHGDDLNHGLPEYAASVVAAAAGHDEVILVGQSMGAVTVPIAAPELPVSGVVLVNAMIPMPGETPGEW